VKSYSRVASTQIAIGSRARIPRTFFDSNILIYAEDPKDYRKQKIALDLISEHARLRTGTVSIQVLSEYFSTVTRKLMLNAGLARAQVEFYSLFQVVEPKTSDVLVAIDLHRLRNISYWDALIVHCAKLAGCRELLSEDMQHGQVIDGVRIVNPFL
jgi:predicted nucleic acid-binding protein